MLSSLKSILPRYGSVRCAAKHFTAIALFYTACFSATAAEGPRIVAFGDSLTAGFGLPQRDGFVPQLDDWLADHDHAEAVVVNMGVSGDTTAGGKARLDWALADGADAVILALGGNDMLRGVAPKTARANLDDILDRLSAMGIPVLIAGMRAPLNYGPDYQRDFDAMYPELAAEHDALLYPFFLEGLIGAADLFQADGLHPNKAGVAVMVEGIGPQVIELIGRIDR